MEPLIIKIGIAYLIYRGSDFGIKYELWTDKNPSKPGTYKTYRRYVNEEAG